MVTGLVSVEWHDVLLHEQILVDAYFINDDDCSLYNEWWDAEYVGHTTSYPQGASDDRLIVYIQRKSVPVNEFN
jgi:hypothetical protein